MVTPGFHGGALAEAGGAVSLHTWIELTGALKLYPPLGTGSVHLAEYGIELAKAYLTDLTKPVWIQEFGGCKEWMSEEAIPEFAERAVRAAASCSNLWGFTWWCSHDIDPVFGGFWSIEYQWA